MLLKQWLPRWARRPLGILVGLLEPRLAARLDATLVADSATGERFKDRVRNVLVVRNFPWRGFAEKVDTDADHKYDVIYHGTLPSYHIDNFVATAVKLRDRGLVVRWCLVAREYSIGEQQELERRLEQEGLRDCFTLYFNVPFQEIPSILAASRVGFIPLPDTLKFRNNFPRKLFEFMALGMPSVVSDLPPARELLGETGCCLFAPPDDPAAYADALHRVLDNEPLAQTLGQRGKRLIRDEMNAEAELQPYISLCRKLRGREKL